MEFCFSFHGRAFIAFEPGNWLRPLLSQRVYLRFTDTASALKQRAAMHLPIITTLLLTTAVSFAAPPTDEQLLEKVKQRGTALEEVTKEPVIMHKLTATMCMPAPAALVAEEKGNPHLDKFARLYVDKAGRPAAEGHEPVHPEGTVLIKEKLPVIVDKEKGPVKPGTVPELFTGMLKREKGFNPECGDWEFFTVSGDAQKLTARGKIASCMECHQRYLDRDFTSRYFVQTRLARAGEDGSVLLHSRDAYVRGKNMRYEPQPHKNTLGYWTVKEDTALWHAKIPKGRYEVEVLQGCGKGSGGAEVLVDFGKGEGLSAQQFKFTVEDTGHFQNFKPRVIGTLEVSGDVALDVKVIPQTKPGAAVMDLRQILLRPVKP